MIASRSEDHIAGSTRIIAEVVIVAVYIEVISLGWIDLYLSLEVRLI